MAKLLDPKGSNRSGFGTKAKEVKLASLTNPARPLGQYFSTPERTHGFNDIGWAGRRILHDRLVLSATQEVLDTGSAGDLSLKMFAALAVGVALWVAASSADTKPTSTHRITIARRLMPRTVEAFVALT
jgi:hypothetical protein